MVAPMVLAALIGAGSSLAGGLMSARRRRIERREDQARQDNQLQRLMADAGLAGIHPVAAMGMSGDYGSPVGSADVFGDAISEAGGRVSDYVLAQQDFTLAAQDLELERMRLDNEAKAFELAQAQSRSILAGLRAASADAVVAPGPMVAGTTFPGATGGGGDVDIYVPPADMGFQDWQFLPATPAEEFENQYGDEGPGPIFGWGNFFRDWFYNSMWGAGGFGELSRQGFGFPVGPYPSRSDRQYTGTPTFTAPRGTRERY